jgi:16S rRNA (guanine(966)-N(2))-methyltransferase RsmD
LDLFCGTGNISYEFLSQGCENVTCVDNNSDCIRFVKESGEKMFPEKLHVIRSDAFRFVKNCKSKFDIVFADPPFSMENVWDLPDLVLENNLLNEGGWFILEHSSHSKPSCKAPISDTRKYGHTSFSFFKPVIPQANE